MSELAKRVAVAAVGIPLVLGLVYLGGWFLAVPRNHHQVKSLAPAVYYIEQYYRGKVSVEDAAKCCGMSPFRFSRAFKSAFGKTFRDYLVNHRLKEACRLLANPAVTVTDVTYAVGFNDPSYFARIFKQRFGTSPSMAIGTGELPVPIGVGEI
jgi:AraC-like DNA-binding protein